MIWFPTANEEIYCIKFIRITLLSGFLMVSSFAGPSPAHIQEPIWICDSMGWRAAASPGSSQQLLAIVEPATVQREIYRFLFGGATAPSLGAVACVSLTL